MSRERDKIDLGIWWEEMGPPVAIEFPAADTRRDVAHGLDAVPHGFLIEDADGPVYRTPGATYGRDIAYLESSVAGTRAIVRFFTRREGLL